MIGDLMYNLFVFIYSIVTFIYYRMIRGIYLGKDSVIRFPSSVKNPARKIRIGTCFIGKNSRISSYSYSGKKYGKIDIGDNFCAQMDFMVSSLEGGVVEIGNNVLCGSRVSIVNNNHRVFENCDGVLFDYGNIKIGDNVWLGEGVTVCKDVTIGDNVIIGAGAVVTKDIPSDTIAVGVPARVIKKYNFAKKEYDSV